MHICDTELLINLNISQVILYFPTCLTFSPDDILYVSDNGNNRLLRIASRYMNGDYNTYTIDNPEVNYFHDLKS